MARDSRTGCPLLAESGLGRVTARDLGRRLSTDSSANCSASDDLRKATDALISNTPAHPGDTSHDDAHERTRSVIHASEFLTEIRGDEALPESVRNEAQRSLRHYPTISDVLRAGRQEEQEGRRCQSADSSSNPFSALRSMTAADGLPTQQGRGAAGPHPSWGYGAPRARRSAPEWPLSTQSGH